MNQTATATQEAMLNRMLRHTPGLEDSIDAARCAFDAYLAIEALLEPNTPSPGDVSLDRVKLWSLIRTLNLQMGSAISDISFATGLVTGVEAA